MNEEKSMIEYKGPKGIFQWLKSKFERLKERFSTNKNAKEIKEEIQDGVELAPEQLTQEILQIGVPQKFINAEESKAKIDSLKSNPWTLNEEEKKEVEKGYEDINNNNQENGEILLEDADKIIAGHSIIEEDGFSK